MKEKEVGRKRNKEKERKLYSILSNPQWFPTRNFSQVSSLYQSYLLTTVGQFISYQIICIYRFLFLALNGMSSIWVLFIHLPSYLSKNRELYSRITLDTFCLSAQYSQDDNTGKLARNIKLQSLQLNLNVHVNKIPT